MEEIIGKSGNYSLLGDYPELQLDLIDKYVTLKLIKNKTFSGFIHSIDPETLSIILSVLQQDIYETVILPGHAILSIDIVEPDNPNIKPPQRKKSTSSSCETVIEKKTKLVAWLQTNLLPVSEMDSKIVVGSASILPPFNVTDICTDNPIVALQIKGIMEKMPHDFTS